MVWVIVIPLATFCLYSHEYFFFFPVEQWSEQSKQAENSPIQKSTWAFPVHPEQSVRLGAASLLY